MPEPRRSRRKQRLWVQVLRWTVAAAAMAATWAYGAWKGGTLLWLALAAGPIVLVCTAAALTIPVISMALVAVAFIHGIDSGVTQSLRDSAGMIVLIGLGTGGWRIVTGLRERDRRR